VRVHVNDPEREAELIREAQEWADRFRDNEIGWEGHGDTLSEAADLIDRLLTLVAAPLLPSNQQKGLEPEGLSLRASTFP
jgi:hypothetical protein